MTLTLLQVTEHVRQARAGLAQAQRALRRDLAAAAETLNRSLDAARLDGGITVAGDAAETRVLIELRPRSASDEVSLGALHVTVLAAPLGETQALLSLPGREAHPAGRGVAELEQALLELIREAWGAGQDVPLSPSYA